MKEYFLAIDIGNTSISFGIFYGRKLIKIFRIATALDDKRTKIKLRKNIKKYSALIKDALICSVVPKKTLVIEKLLKRQLKIKIKIVGKHIRVPIRNLYKKPAMVGRDRLVNAYACRHFYTVPAVIIDFGTATTFDYLNKKGEYAGGIIAPGIEISLDALAQRTALLPKIKMQEPKVFLGKTTLESIVSGAGYGLTYMCDGIIRGFKQRYGKNIKVIATGGLANFFRKRCKRIDVSDKNLTLKGLFILASLFSDKQA